MKYNTNQHRWPVSLGTRRGDVCRFSGVASFPTELGSQPLAAQEKRKGGQTEGPQSCLNKFQIITLEKLEQEVQ